MIKDTTLLYMLNNETWPTFSACTELL